MSSYLIANLEDVSKLLLTVYLKYDSEQDTIPCASEFRGFLDVREEFANPDCWESVALGFFHYPGIQL